MPATGGTMKLEPAWLLGLLLIAGRAPAETAQAPTDDQMLRACAEEAQRSDDPVGRSMRCLREARERVQHLLDDTYYRLNRSLPPAQREKLVASQVAWSRYYDAQTELTMARGLELDNVTEYLRIRMMWFRLEELNAQNRITSAISERGE
ncbi:hypothetical protein ASE35_01080 [Lysobacter sp. Root916]|nr:hypothetical protein ASE35_01080 [Lysobacter sp. Root916]